MSNLAVSKHEKICRMFMLPNTFINFISFVKSSEGITMMRKEYKTKSNYEQMRNDYFCFIPWNRLNIFEIPNIFYQNVIIFLWSRLYIRIKTGYQYLNKSEKFRLNDFRITNFSHCKYFISFSRSFPYQICHLNYSNKTMFLLHTHNRFCWTRGTSIL
mgnify:CR=1 FL=1